MNDNKKNDYMVKCLRTQITHRFLKLSGMTKKISCTLIFDFCFNSPKQCCPATNDSQMRRQLFPGLMHLNLMFDLNL